MSTSLLDSPRHGFRSTPSAATSSAKPRAAYMSQNTTTWSNWFRTLLGLREDRVDMHVRALQVPPDSGTRVGEQVLAQALDDLRTLGQDRVLRQLWRRLPQQRCAWRDRPDRPLHGRLRRCRRSSAASGAELGLRTQIVPGLQTSLAFWRLDSDSELVYAADAGATEPNGASKRHGVEWNNQPGAQSPGCWSTPTWRGRTRASRAAIPTASRATSSPTRSASVGLLGVTLHELGPWSAGFVRASSAAIRCRRTAR